LVLFSVFWTTLKVLSFLVLVLIFLTAFSGQDTAFSDHGMITLSEGNGQRDKASTYLDPPLSQCKGRKKRLTRFQPTVEKVARQRRTCSYCHNKEAHNIRTCPKVIIL
jgi:hypothetical protein